MFEISVGPGTFSGLSFGLGAQLEPANVVTNSSFPSNYTVEYFLFFIVLHFLINNSVYFFIC